MIFASQAKPTFHSRASPVDEAEPSQIAELAIDLAEPEPANDNIKHQTALSTIASPYGATTPNMWWVP